MRKDNSVNYNMYSSGQNKVNVWPTCNERATVTAIERNAKRTETGSGNKRCPPTIKFTVLLALFPGSPRARTKNRKERGEPGKIYHVRNVIGRENLITCGRTNELAHAAWTEYSCDSFMADRMGLDGTMLHYLAVRKAMVSVHRPIHSKITLTYSLTWQTDRFTPRRIAFKALLNAISWALLKFSLPLIIRKNCQNGLLLKNSYVYCQLSINYVRGHTDDPPTLN